jgi:GTPase SAR1 family protein
MTNNTPKIYSKTQICLSNRRLVTLGVETDVVATFDTPEKAKEFSDRLNQAIEDIFNELTEGESQPEMSEKERSMVEKCINLSAQIRALSDEMAALFEQHMREKASVLGELIKQHSEIWSELNSEFGDDTGDLGDKPYFNEMTDFGPHQQIISDLQDLIS